MKKLLYLSICLLCAKSLYAQTQNATLVIPIGHTGGITAVDITPDDRYFLTASLDQTIKIWDANGHEIRSLAGHSMNVLAAAFSPKTAQDSLGGQFILSGGSDHKAILWDKLGSKIAEFSEPAANGVVNAVAFSPNGEELLIGLKDGTARLLSKSCVEIRRFQHNAEITSVAFSPDGNLILTACKDKTAVLWKRTDNTRPHKVLSGHQGDVSDAVFAPTGDAVLTGSMDGTAILWNLTDGKRQNFQHGGEIQSVAYSPDGQHIATGNSEGTIKIWELKSKEPKTIKRAHRGISSLIFSANGQSIVSGSDTDWAVPITLLNGTISLHLKGYTSAISAMALSPDGSSLLVAHADSTVKIWDLSSQKVQNIRYPDGIESVDFSPIHAADTLGGRFFLVGCRDRVCRLYPKNRDTVFQLKQANRGVFSADGKSILTSNADGTTQFWDLTSKQAQRITHSERNVTASVFSPAKGSRAFAIGSRNGVVVYWDSLGANPVTMNLRTTSAIEAMDFSSDGKSLVCGVKGGSTEIVDIATQRVVQTNQLRRLGNIKAITFLPNTQNGTGESKQILRAAGKNVEIWNTSNNNITTFTGHLSDVTALAISPDGEQFYSGSEDGTIKIWDIASGKEKATMVSIGSSDWAISSPSGLYDASTEAMKRMHYSVGMDVVSLRQIKERYWEPGLLAKITGFSQDTIRSVAKFDNISMFPDVHMQLVGHKLNISLTEQNGGIGKLSLIINGKRIKSDINPPDPSTGKRLKKLPPLDLNEYSNWYRTDTVNTIGLISYNKENVLRSQPFELHYEPVRARGENNTNPAASGANCGSVSPHLYLIVVGTSKYQDSTRNLVYPDEDAAAIADALSAVGKAMLVDKAKINAASPVHLKLLTTSKSGKEFPTKENIKSAFDEFASMATPCDVLVVYFSGHGSTWGPEGKRSNFFYLTSAINEGKLRDAGIRAAHAISDEDLEHWLTAIPAQKQVLILDACNSGKAAENLKGLGKKDFNSNQSIAMGLLNDRTGAYILTGSMADMLSWEASMYGQGLLTYSLLLGMSGASVKDGRNVDVLQLFDFACNKVPELAEAIGQKQTPVAKYEGRSFPIGIIDETVSIKLLQAKPVFIQSSFQVAGYFEDTLNLGQALNDHFYAERLKGKNARYVYYNTSSVLPDSYRVRGDYSVSGETVTLKANLFKGNKTVGEAFEVKASTKKKDLVNGILKVVIPRLPPLKM